MSNEKQEVINDVLEDMRKDAEQLHDDYLGDPVTFAASEVVSKSFNRFADRIAEITKREAQMLERIVRDAVVDYNMMYPSAPNDDCERELAERAKLANSWLTAHGMEPEPFYYSPEGSN